MEWPTAAVPIAVVIAGTAIVSTHIASRHSK